MTAPAGGSSRQELGAPLYINSDLWNLRSQSNMKEPGAPASVRLLVSEERRRLHRSLLRHLTADLAAGVRRGVDVDVVLAAEQVGGLRIGQRRTAFDRAS